jgi:uracil phosphoribosyltransferase
MEQKIVKVIDHPLVQHKLTLMRNKQTSSAQFRTLLKEISILLAYEVTRDLPLEMVDIETPITSMKAPMIGGKKLVLVSILRAGNGILDGMLELIPSARIGHIGIYRDPKTMTPVEYYFKMPVAVEGRDIILVDPMIATGNSACAAVARLKTLKPRSIRFVSLISCPEGIENFHEEHPDVPIFTASCDERLNEKGFIVPGLGDAGDRLFGTKEG